MEEYTLAVEFQPHPYLVDASFDFPLQNQPYKQLFHLFNWNIQLL